MAAALFSLAACNKDNGNNGSDDNGGLVAPVNAKNAIKINLADNELNLKSIELTESGKYILAFADPVKATIVFRYKTGVYTVNGQTFNLKGYGTAEIHDDYVVVKPDGYPTSIKVNLSKGDVYPDTGIYNTLARTWKVDNVRMSVVLNGNTITVTKNGCDLPAIAAELKQKGVNVNEQLVAGYVVQDVIFTRAKTFAIEFTGKDPYVGQYNLSSNGSFSYDFQVPGNDIINGSSTGQATFDNETKQMVVTINATVTNGTSTFNGTATLYLSEKK